MTRRSKGAGGLRAATAGLCAAGLGALLLSGCGIPLESSAQPVAVPRVISPSTTFPSTATNQTNVNVYFTSSGRIVPRLRAVSIHQELADAVHELLLGPTVDEQRTGIATALGYGTIHPLSLHHGGGVVTVNFSADFGLLSGPQEVLAVAQVVYTVAAVDPGEGVVFELDGAVIEVPVEDGALVNGPVHASQYGGLVAAAKGDVTTGA